MVTHDARVLDIADRIVEMQDGHLVPADHSKGTTADQHARTSPRTQAQLTGDRQLYPELSQT